MSIQSEINRVKQNVTDTYSALSEMGATMPEEQNSDNLAATARTVPAGGSPDAVLYTEQTLTEEQKKQARKNIGAAEEGGTGGSFVQTDWEQKDETAADFIKNKPFGDVEVVVLEEQELAFDPEGGLMAIALAPIQDGDRLTVVFDGEIYTCDAAFNVELNAVMFGNQGLMGGEIDSGEPFVGAYMDGMVLFMTPDEANHTVGVVAAAVEQIPAKYLGLPTLYINQYDVYLYTDAGCTTKATIADFPYNTNFAVGYSYSGVVSYLYYPNSASTAIFAHEFGLCEVTIWRGTKYETYYTAEYTPPTT